MLLANLLQKEVDGRSINMKREHVKQIRKIREVNKYWNEISSDLVTGIKSGDFLEGGGSQQKRVLFQCIAQFPRATRLNLRNMDSLVDSDLSIFFTPRHFEYLRVLNVGGCYKLTDDAIDESLKLCKSLCHLNLACTLTSDFGLEIIADNLPSIITLNLFGCKMITKTGCCYAASKLKKMESFNLRGASSPVFATDAQKTIKESCFSESCEILVGEDKGDSYFNTR